MYKRVTSAPYRLTIEQFGKRFVFSAGTKEAMEETAKLVKKECKPVIEPND